MKSQWKLVHFKKPSICFNFYTFWSHFNIWLQLISTGNLVKLCGKNGYRMFLIHIIYPILVWYNRHTFPWCTKHLIWFVCTLNLSITQGSLTDTPMSVKTWYLPNRALMTTYKIQHTTKDHSCWNSRKCLSTRVFTLIFKLMQIDYTIEHCRVYPILPVIGNWCGF